MKTKLVRVAFALALAVLANVIGFYVLLQNQRNGVYSPDADSLAIPIFENGALSIGVVLLMTGSILCSRSNSLVNAAGIVMGLLASGLAALLALQWLGPNHYSMAAAFGVLATITVALMYMSFRKERVS